MPPSAPIALRLDQLHAWRVYYLYRCRQLTWYWGCTHGEGYGEDSVLSTPSVAKTISEASALVIKSEGWDTALRLYEEETNSQWANNGRRKNRFVDLMNYIVDEAPRCGAPTGIKHHIRYGRHDYKGFDDYAPDNPEIGKRQNWTNWEAWQGVSDILTTVMSQ